MKPHFSSRSNLKTTLSIILVLLWFVACAPKAQITVLQPAEINTSDIQNVAIGTFEVVSVTKKFKQERRGEWSTVMVPLTAEQKQAIGTLVRSQVVNLLATTPSFRINFTDEFSKLENDAQLQQLISVQGYQTQGVDAVISGRVWIDIEKVDGAEPAKVTLKYLEPGAGQQNQNFLDIEVEQLIWWPYKSARGSLSLEMKMTQLSPSQVVAVTFDTRNYSKKIGGKPAGGVDQVLSGLEVAGSFFSDSNSSGELEKQELENSDLVLPPFEQMITELSSSIAANFVQRVSITEKRVNYPIATGGDENGKLLIEASAYETAITRLQETTANNVQKADDLYNLGLAFEAKGDYGLALNFYRDAHNQEPENLIYAQGIGRIEKLQRESILLRKQLQK